MHLGVIFPLFVANYKIQIKNKMALDKKIQDFEHLRKT